MFTNFYDESDTDRKHDGILSGLTKSENIDSQTPEHFTAKVLISEANLQK
jgi:hypothetical protein